MNRISLTRFAMYPNRRWNLLSLQRSIPETREWARKSGPLGRSLHSERGFALSNRSALALTLDSCIMRKQASVSYPACMGRAKRTQTVQMNSERQPGAMIAIMGSRFVRVSAVSQSFDCCHPSHSLLGC